LYDSLMSAMEHQLRLAGQKLDGVSPASLPGRIDELLPDISVLLRNFLLGLAQEGALHTLPEVADAFVQLGTGQRVQLINAEVTSADPLSPEQQERIERDLRRQFGEGLTVQFAIDESLIGGLILRVGDRVVDNSLRARLSQLQRNLQSS
jgi:F-type H+-transporting ATPase subunit delta